VAPERLRTKWLEGLLPFSDKLGETNSADDDIDAGSVVCSKLADSLRFVVKVLLWLLLLVVDLLVDIPATVEGVAVVPNNTPPPNRGSPAVTSLSSEFK
jgi:hypothetical protein